jgi:hypothetical protein
MADRRGHREYPESDRSPTGKIDPSRTRTHEIASLSRTVSYVRLNQNRGTGMPERDIFRLIVRSVGMISIGFGLPDIAGNALSKFGLPVRPGLTPLHVAAAGIAYLLSGFVLLFAAPLITRLVYGSRK